MSHLPVIVGMGGVNPAGRTSGHQAFRRTVLDALPEAEQTSTLLGLAAMMRLAHCDADQRWHNAQGQVLDAAQLAQETASVLQENRPLASSFSEVAPGGSRGGHPPRG